MKHIVAGILAHVDAGKTTLTEGLLYSSGTIMSLGRVDKGNAYLDNHSIERERGITVFSKQAVIETDSLRLTLIDTPGHIDFSCEAERALSVQDYAILLISAPDGVTAHTKTLWHLLAARRIPTFIFVNKTDISDRRREDIMNELSAVLSHGCVDFSCDTSADFFESCASLDEGLMAEFFESEALELGGIVKAIKKRRIFPCFFGSALKMRGISEFISAFDKYTEEPSYSEDFFGARVYKISRDRSGNRLTYMKITGGSLRPKDTLALRDTLGGEVTEKVEEIRIYSGEKYKSVNEARAGDVCAVTGLNASRIGGGIGFEGDDGATLAPVLDYRIILPDGASPYEYYLKFLALTEEDPTLGITYEASNREMRVKLMGEIQLEVLKRLISDRFGIDVTFDEGRVLYKETLAEPVHGAGHFEPLRHYAEVHLLLEPLPEGSGVLTAVEVPPDTLGLNWQRLIVTHLEERVHRGVLTGSPLTDVKITLLAGAAHLKHTEGGDFRRATYRAVRQGLRKGTSILLEPTFDFRIELPAANLGRAMSDVTVKLHGTVKTSEVNGEDAILEGTAPVFTMRSYPTELRAYTAGAGRIVMTPGAYAPCHNRDEVIADYGYDPDLDERNTADSVFCKQGSGFVVPWYEADEYMHLTPEGIKRGTEAALADADTSSTEARAQVEKKRSAYLDGVAEDRELMRIFEATYGKIKPKRYTERVVNEGAKVEKKPKKERPRGEEYLIIDGYNLIYAWDDLRKSAECDLALARDKLIRIACDFSAMKRCRVLVVFDAYKRKDKERDLIELGKVSVIYTKEAQTADAFIEKTTYEISGEHYVRVVTSDMQEQFVILGNGAYRVSPKEFIAEYAAVTVDIKDLSESK